MSIPAFSHSSTQRDTISTDAGPVIISFIGHGTLMLEWSGKVIHVDPWSKLADYSSMPKADLILITHEHQDHLDTAAISHIATDSTAIVTNQSVHGKIGRGKTMSNGDSLMWQGMRIDAVPAYNTTAGRDKFHPKGRDNGFILTIGTTRIYIAGDTENTPEMESLPNIDIAFLPMNQPYTMTPEQVAHAAKAFKPRALYPYHTGETPVEKLVELMNGVKNVEVRVRAMK